MHKYRVHLAWSDADQSWIATVPDLPYCAADGATPQEALDNAQEAIDVWLDVAQETGKPIPSPRLYTLSESA